MNLSKLTKNMKLPKFFFNIKTFLMIGLLIFYLVIIVSHFFMKVFENFDKKEQSIINTMNNQITDLSANLIKQNNINSKNSIDNNTLMTKIIPELQKNIFDLSSNFYGANTKIAGLQPAPLIPTDLSGNISNKPLLDASGNIVPTPK